MTATQSSQSAFTLPSLQEMFPEHLLSLPPTVRLSIMTTTKPFPPLGIRTTDIGDNFRRPKKSLSKRPSSNHVLPYTSSTNLPESSVNHTVVSSSERISSPTSLSPSASSPNWTDEDQMDEDVDDCDDSMTDPSRKHTCEKCGRRFNRPSSLRIHTNIHTGETPFRCPFPGCGRLFNVNSNMRRHYRNHAVTATTNSSVSGSEVIDFSIVPRQRRKRNKPQQPPPGAEGAAVHLLSQSQGSMSRPLPTAIVHGPGTPAPVLKKAQWPQVQYDRDTSSQDSADEWSDDIMDLDNNVEPRSSGLSMDHGQQMLVSPRPAAAHVTTPTRHPEFNYPVYTSARRANRGIGSNHYGTQQIAISSPTVASRHSTVLKTSSERYQRRHSRSLSKSPRSSLMEISRLVR